MGPSGITLGHILQAAFEDMGGYFDLIKTILGTPGTNFETSYRILLDILTNALGGGGGGGGVKVRCPFWA